LDDNFFTQSQYQAHIAIRLRTPALSNFMPATTSKNGIRLRLLRSTIQALDKLSLLTRRRTREWITGTAGVGRRGEAAAYLYLRSLGYVIVARRWRTATLRGDIDLIAWQNEQLCMIEVKTRSTRDAFAAEFAVDDRKQQMLRRMANAYLRQLCRPDTRLDSYLGSREVTPRFDIVSVYLNSNPPQIELREGCFTL